MELLISLIFFLNPSASLVIYLEKEIEKALSSRPLVMNEIKIQNVLYKFEQVKFKTPLNDS